MNRKRDKIIFKWGLFKRHLVKINCINIHTVRVPEEERVKGKENVFEDIIAENLPILGKETDIQVMGSESQYDQPKDDHTKSYY